MASSRGKEKMEEKFEYCYEPNCYNGVSNTKLGPFPPGFKFKPSDEELVIYYLRPKVDNMELPPNKIHDIDLYDPVMREGCNPQQLCARYEAQGEEEWYFFTSRDRKYPNGSRPNRASGGGFWKASGKDEPISYSGAIIGYKKTLVFYMGKPPFGQKTNWIMHEFRLNYDHTNTPQIDNAPKSERMKLDDWVLCRIHYNTKVVKLENGLKKERKKPAKKAKCEPSSANSTLEDIKGMDYNMMTILPQNMGYPTHDIHWNAWTTDIPSSSTSTPEDVKITDNNTITILPQNVGYPTHDTHWSAWATDIPSSSTSTQEDVNIIDNNTMTILPQNVGYPTHDTHWSAWTTDIPSSLTSTPEDVKITDNNMVTILPQNVGYPIHDPRHWSVTEDVKITDNNTVTILPQNMGYPTHDTHWSAWTTDIPSSSTSTQEDVKIIDNNTVTILPQNVGYPTHDTHWSAWTTNILSSSTSTPEDIKITDNNRVTILPQNVGYPIHDTRHWSVTVADTPSTSGETYENNLNQPIFENAASYGIWRTMPFPNNSLVMENGDHVNICNTELFMEDALSPLPNFAMEFEDDYLDLDYLLLPNSR